MVSVDDKFVLGLVKKWAAVGALATLVSNRASFIFIVANQVLFPGRRKMLTSILFLLALIAVDLVDKRRNVLEKMKVSILKFNLMEVQLKFDEVRYQFILSYLTTSTRLNHTHSMRFSCSRGGRL